VVNAVSEGDPTSYNAAMRSKDVGNWTVAVNEEIQSLKESKTWKLVKKPTKVRVLHTKWVFKTKTNADGSVERYKSTYGCMRK
jgi:hypothetical protein